MANDLLLPLETPEWRLIHTLNISLLLLGASSELKLEAIPLKLRGIWARGPPKLSAFRSSLFQSQKAGRPLKMAL